MSTVAINMPKTPVTTGSNGLATAAVPNVCKMPGPPAPFVPTPLPNIGKSGMSPQGFSTTVTIEGCAVAIQGATFGSMGDIASKATGGGIVSANTQGPTAFVAPGSMDVKIEGKNVQLLGDATTNNNGSPPNASTPAEMQSPETGAPAPYKSGIDCEQNKKPPPDGKGWDDCDVAQLCAKVKKTNKLQAQNKLSKQSPGRNNLPDYKATKQAYYGTFATGVSQKNAMSEAFLKSAFYHPCAKERWEKGGRPAKPNDSSLGRGAFQADHVHECQLGCDLKDITNFKMLSQSVNGAIGPSLSGFDPSKHSEVTLPKCDCP